MSILPAELAMVVRAVANFSIEDYIKAIESLVHELVYATKSFNNKYVFFFVSSQKAAELLRTKYRKINIKSYELQITPVAYIRIQLCNVPKVLCNEDIKRQLENLNVDLLSKIKDDQNGSSDKIVYIHLSDNDLIPMSLKISNGRDSFQVSLRRCMVCSICNDNKHKALDCPAALLIINNNSNAPDKVIARSSNDAELHPIKKPCIREQMDYHPDKIHYDVTLAPMKEKIDASSIYPLNFKDFVSFLYETFGYPSKALEIARKYTNNIEGLLVMLNCTRKSKDRNTNVRLNTLRKALELQLEKEEKYMYIRKKQSTKTIDRASTT